MWTDYAEHYNACMFIPELRARVLGPVEHALRLIDADYTHLAGRGHSGITAAACLADRLGKSLIIVRKSINDCHSGSLVNAPDRGSYVLVDDFVNSGNTIHRALEAIRDAAPELVCRGILLYREHQEAHVVEETIRACLRRNEADYDIPPILSRVYDGPTTLDGLRYEQKQKRLSESTDAANGTGQDNRAA